MNGYITICRGTKCGLEVWTVTVDGTLIGTALSQTGAIALAKSFRNRK